MSRRVEVVTKSGKVYHLFVKPVLEVIRCGGLIITDTSKISYDELIALRRRLTFDNPKFEKVMKYSKYSYTNVPESLYYYAESGDFISIPLGFPLCKFFGEKFNLKYDYALDFSDTLLNPPPPPFSLDLRDDQKIALRNYLSLNSASSQPDMNGLIQLPTGKGKSILGLAIASALKCKTLIVVHKDDLVTGWKKDIKLSFDNKVTAGLIKAKSREVGHFLTIATVQTLNRLSPDEMSKLKNQFGLVITDECLIGDTLVTMSNGDYKYIKDIKNGDEVLVGGKVSNFFHRESNIWELRSRHSFIKGSPTHKTFVIKKKDTRYAPYTLKDVEVKQLKDIDCSSYMLPIRLDTCPDFSSDIPPIGDKLVSFVALIMCAGHLDRTGNRVKINVAKNLDFYEKTFVDGIPCFKNAIYNKSFDVRDNLTIWTTTPKIKEYLETEWKIPRGKKNNIVDIPNWFLNANSSDMKAFISTCFSCSGDLGYKDEILSFNCTSKNFTFKLGIMLRKFGIMSSFNIVKSSSPTKNTIYRLNIGGINFVKFVNTFDIIDYKVAVKTTKNVNKNKYLENYYLSEIVSCEPTNEIETVYDFTVEDSSHSFIANGILTHNCHHTPASTYSIITEFNAPYRLGLTATPERADGLGHVMQLYFGDFCYRYDEHATSEHETDILPVKVEMVNLPVKFDPVCISHVTKNGNTVWSFDKEFKRAPNNNDVKLVYDIPYNLRPLIPFGEIDNFVVTHPSTVSRVCRDLVNAYHSNKSCVVFFTQKKHCDYYYSLLVTEFNLSRVQIYNGDTKDPDIALKRAEEKEILITLTTLAKSTEGTNVKAWEHCFLVSSMNNGKNVEQAVGRVRRIKEGKELFSTVHDYYYPNAYSLRNHKNTRLQRYRKMNIKDIKIK